MGLWLETSPLLTECVDKQRHYCTPSADLLPGNALYLLRVCPPYVKVARCALLALLQVYVFLSDTLMTNFTLVAANVIYLGEVRVSIWAYMY